MIYKAFIFNHLLSLMQSYFELRADRPPLDFVQGMHMASPMNTGTNESVCQIPVRLPRDTKEVNALVSCEDYDKIAAVSPVWRLSSKGYVVSTKNKKVTFLHRLVRDSPSVHENGDKLDNRRQNVIPSKRGTKKMKGAEEEEELIIKTISPLLNFATTPENTPFESKYSNINYAGNMNYTGEINYFKPHGFGTLTEENKMSLGWWQQGIFKSGLVLYLKPVPCCMRMTAPLPPIQYAVLVVDEKKV